MAIEKPLSLSSGQIQQFQVGNLFEVAGQIVSTGLFWTIRTSPADNSWNSVTYGNGLFVAVSTTGSGNRVMTSPDGINWTIRTSPADNSWESVTYGNGLFVAVSVTGTGNRVMTSPDGINWTIRTSAANNAWNAVTYGNGLFVAVSSTGSGNRVMTSPDGINWTLRTSSADNTWQAVTYGNGLFVAVANSGTGTRVMTSPDGITWTTRTSAADNSWQAITYGNGLFVAIANSGTGNRVMTSPDGITWTARTSAADNSWNSVTYGNGLFIVVASTGSGNQVMTSPDGINWTTRTNAVDSSWRAIIYGNGLFVAVSILGSGNRVMTSGHEIENIISDIPSSSPRLLAKSGTTAGPNNSTAEISLFSYVVPANILGATGGLRVAIWGDWLINTTAATITIRIKFGTTTLYSEITASQALDADPGAFSIIFDLYNTATNAQVMGGDIWGSSRVAATTGIGDLTTLTGAAGQIGWGGPIFGAASSEDTTVDKTLDITAQLSAAGASNRFEKQLARIELLP